MFRSFKLSLIATLFAATLSAQEGQFPFERWLLPIAPGPVLNGAHGSLWTTELMARNDADALVLISQYPFRGICVGSCVLPSPPKWTLRFLPIVSDSSSGAFMYVGSPGAGKVFFSLRVRDLSRQSQTWGTAVPVVRESDVFTTRLTLLDIPTDDRFRVALRAYDFDDPADRRAVARVYDVMSNAVLAEATLTLSEFREGHVLVPSYPPFPGRAAITDLIGAFPQLRGAPSKLLRIEIEPLTPGLRFWAFASVTNNETQHVTVLSPYRN